MTDDSILIEREHGIGWIRINRPERLTAFSGTRREDLEQRLAEFEDDASIRCVIITGNGRAFSTGGDITVMSEIIAAEDIERFEYLVRAGAAIVRRINAMSKPVIAAVNGPAAGAGACLALACDVRIATDTAAIGFTFTRVGLHPDWGGSYFLPQIVGDAVALGGAGVENLDAIRGGLVEAADDGARDPVVAAQEDGPRAGGEHLPRCFLLFAGSRPAPQGGLGDLVGAFTSEAAARAPDPLTRNPE